MNNNKNKKTNEKKLICDLHTHPLSHKYYSSNTCSNSIELDKQDKGKIQNFVNWCYYTRGLDVVAITDHDLVESSLHAKEYVEKNNIPIKIITGAECEFNWNPSSDSPKDDMECLHLLALGIKKLPKYNSFIVSEYEDIRHFVDEVHDNGGIVVMSHPIYSPISFYRIAHMIDGFEILNRDTTTFADGEAFNDDYKLNLCEHINSDFHYENEDFLKYVPINVDFRSESEINKLLW